MPRKYLIEIQGNKPLSEYGDNHIIAYDSNSKSYYVTTAESFFANQNSKINDLTKSISELNNSIRKMENEIFQFEQGLAKKVNSFQNETNVKFENFLTQYQDTNAKLIAMVKELIGANEEE